MIKHNKYLLSFSKNEIENGIYYLFRNFKYSKSNHYLSGVFLKNSPYDKN